MKTFRIDDRVVKKQDAESRGDMICLHHHASDSALVCSLLSGSLLGDGVEQTTWNKEAVRLYLSRSITVFHAD